MHNFPKKTTFQADFAGPSSTARSKSPSLPSLLSHTTVAVELKTTAGQAESVHDATAEQKKREENVGLTCKNSIFSKRNKNFSRAQQVLLVLLEVYRHHLMILRPQTIEHRKRNENVGK